MPVLRVAPRSLATVLVAATALVALAEVLPNVELGREWAAPAAAVLIGLVNALAWPLLVRLALPFTVLTLGLGALALNGAVVVGVAALLPGFAVGGLVSGMVVALGLTAATTLLSAVFALDDDDERFAAAAVRRARRGRGTGRPHDVPGILFLEIDGLAVEVLRRALRDGDAPTLARWLREGRHRLVGWETDWSSQTGAMQAGLLHGDNDDIPAFRWWEKDRGRPLVTNRPRDAAELERRVSDGRGLLHADGASRANILSGDAPHTLLTMSTVLDRDRPKRLGHDYFAYFAAPGNTGRTLLRALYDIGAELRAAAEQRRRDVHPRIDRGLRYALVRAFATVVQLDLQVHSVIADIVAGRPTVYTTFLAYDEVAHHSGIERADTLAVLRRVDRAIGRIAAAATMGPRPYEVVVLSDHGQTQGATFRQRYGQTLEQLVAEAAGARALGDDGSGEDEARGRIAAALTEAAAGEGAGARAVERATRGRRVDGEVRVGEPAPAAPGAGEEVPEVVVMASGNLGLVSFPRLPGRVTLEELALRYPRLVPALRAHPGIGFLLVRSAEHGPLVLGRDGCHALASGAVEGTDPLAPFGPNAARHVLRTDGFAHCPDLVLNSTWWPETDEVAAFEELVGSHGGMGGPQAHPFLLAPAGLPLPGEPLVGAEHVHAVMRGWLARLGHRSYAEPDRAPAA
jgi:uncharacterized membrane protein YvlD (DUF360 family)